jgi:endonuclease/exonuclease/phosphatase family metal-dependent hydrolase
MKRTLLAAFIAITSFATAQTRELTAMTFNIRYANPGDGDNRWDLRKANLASVIRFHEADAVGMQEALIGQIRDLESLLPGYAWVGKGRDDGAERGEFSPIFYNPKRLKLLETQTFWLSPTPETPGKAWDANLPRVVTWAKFQPLKGKPFYWFNTHFDHQGQEARRQSARLLLKKVTEIAGKTPVVVTGDFNAQPDAEPIRILTDSNDPARLLDTQALSQTPHFGPAGTFNGFGPKETADQPIDFIFVKNGPIVRQHATLSPTWAGRFASDHHAVLATIGLP